MPPSIRTPSPSAGADDPQPQPQPASATAAAVPEEPKLFVNEGQRQELLAGTRVWDYNSGRELTLEGEGDEATVRFATNAEIEKRGRPSGGITTTDTATLNPT